MRSASQRSAATLRGRARAASPADVTGDCGCGCGGTCGGTRGHAPRASAGGVTGRQLVSSGDIALDAALVNPEQASPGATVEISLDLRETAEFVTPLDPALCAPIDVGFGTGTGLTANIEVTPDWTGGISDSVCIPVSNLGSSTRTVTYTFIAPSLPENSDQESHSVSISIQQPGLDPVQVSRTLTVQEGGFDVPVPINGGGNGGNGGDGDGIPLSLLALATVGVVGGVAVTNLG